MNAPDAGGKTVVEVRDLSVRMIATKTPIVSGVSFDVAERQTMGLVGESGSGKSTVAVALLGFARRGLEISGGSVRVGDVDVLQLKGDALRDARGHLVSYVPQDPAAGLNPAHRIGSQLRESFTVHEKLGKKELEERIADLMEAVNLPTDKQFLRSYPHQLSGGQQQRVVIGIAFACRPKLIVLDEPTTGLDVTTQRYILEKINEMAADYGASAVYVSHDLPAVAQVASKTAVMYAGRIVEVASTSKLFRQPRHPYSAGLLKAAPSADEANRLVGIEGRPPRPGHWPNGCSYAPRCPRAQDDCLREAPQLAPVEGGSEVRCLHPIPLERSGDLALTRRPPRRRSRARRSRCRTWSPGTDRRRSSTTSPSGCRAASARPWSASPVPARRPWRVAWSASTPTGRARSNSTASRSATAPANARANSCAACSTSSRTPSAR